MLKERVTAWIHKMEVEFDEKLTFPSFKTKSHVRNFSYVHGKHQIDNRTSIDNISLSSTFFDSSLSRDVLAEEEMNFQSYFFSFFSIVILQFLNGDYHL